MKARLDDVNFWQMFLLRREIRMFSYCDYKAARHKLYTNLLKSRRQKSQKNKYPGKTWPAVKNGVFFSGVGLFSDEGVSNGKTLRQW